MHQGSGFINRKVIKFCLFYSFYFYEIIVRFTIRVQTTKSVLSYFFAIPSLDPGEFSLCALIEELEDLLLVVCHMVGGTLVLVVRVVNQLRPRELVVVALCVGNKDLVLKV